MPLRIHSTPGPSLSSCPPLRHNFQLQGKTSRSIHTRQHRHSISTPQSSVSGIASQPVCALRDFVASVSLPHHLPHSPDLLQPSRSPVQFSPFNWSLFSYLSETFLCESNRGPPSPPLFWELPGSHGSQLSQRVLRPFLLPATVPALCLQISSASPAPSDRTRTSIWSDLRFDTPFFFGMSTKSAHHQAHPPTPAVKPPVAATQVAVEPPGVCTTGEIPSAELCPAASNCVTPDELGGVEGLARWLEDRLPGGATQLASWGETPATKRVANLWTELTEGEISLEDCRPPKRTVHVASVLIWNDCGALLMESHQEMAGGAVRPRNRPLSEKMKPGERVAEACSRGIAEELGPVLGARDRVTVLTDTYVREEEERESFSYPGLLTRYVVHSMSAQVAHLPAGSFSTEENEYGSCETRRGLLEGLDSAQEVGENGGLKGGGATGSEMGIRLEEDVVVGDGEVGVGLGLMGHVGRGCPMKERAVFVSAGGGTGASLEAAVGVKKHFWVWRPPGELA